MTKQSDPKPQAPKIPYATFTGRMLASVIDTVLSSFLLIPIMNMFNIFFRLESPNIENTRIVAKMTAEQAIANLAAILPSMLIQSTIVAVIVIIFWVYRGATPGKMILKMKIVDAKTLGEPSKKQLIIRYLGYFVSLLTFCLGFVWIYYDKRQQGFHDKMAGTVVIKV
jgi:uncharacterized RDD family membrane protein YckC